VLANPRSGQTPEAPRDPGNRIALRTSRGIPERASHDRIGAKETSKGKEAQGGQARRYRQRKRTRTGPRHGAKPRSRRNGKGATATVTWSGCGEGDSPRGLKPRREDGRDSISIHRWQRRRNAPGTVHGHWQRWSRGGRAGNAANPRSAAGCNKPATVSAEKTVEVVRNHEGGTGLTRWFLGGRSRIARSGGSGRAVGMSMAG